MMVGEEDIDLVNTSLSTEHVSHLLVSILSAGHTKTL